MTLEPAYTPKVSVIVPAYNAEDYLERCVDSLLGQTFGDLEIILVDDGSTDGTGRLIDRYAEKDSRVVPVHTENRGPADARHTGVKRARGAYLAFQDSDDFRPADAIGMLYAKAVESGADVVSSDYYVSCFPGSPDFKHDRRPAMEDAESLTAIKAWINGSLRGGLWSLLVRRELYIGTVSEYLRVMHGEDTIIFVQLLNHARKIVQWRQPTYYYVLREGSLSHYAEQWSVTWVETYAQVTRWMLDYFSRIPGKETFAHELAYYALYRLSLLQLKVDGRLIDFSNLEDNIYAEFYSDKIARRKLRKAWPKQWIYLVSERKVWARWLKKGVWGNPFLRNTLRKTRTTFQKIKS